MYLLRDAAGFFIQAMTQSVHQSLDNDLAVGGKSDPQYNVTLNFKLPCLAGVLH